MKRLLPLTLICLLLSLPFSALTVSGADAFFSAAPANTLGGTCSKVGATAKIGTASAVCAKVGKKQIWQKAKVKAPSVSTSPSSTNTPSASSTPSQTPTLKPVPTSSGTSAVVAQNSYEINVSARTWSWSFSYLVNGSKDLRKGVTPILYIPLGKVVNLSLRSSDDPHGFWVPGLSLEKEVTAAETSHIAFTAKNIDKFPGACSIDCGRDHTLMTFTVEVLSEADFLKYLTTLKTS